MTLEKFTEKYFPNAVQGVEEKNDVVMDMQDVTDRFPISDLPVEILCEVYDRLSIISANTTQKLVCKGWRDIFKERFAAKFPYLETEWSVWENGSVACQTQPTIIHFRGHYPYASKQTWTYMASAYDAINRELEKASAGNKITYSGEREMTKTFDPKEFKRFFFGISRHAEAIYMQKFDKFSMSVFVSDIHENFGVAFIFKSVQASKPRK
jgi:hypothetical protein